MIKEIYWEKAIDQSNFAVDQGCLFPLETVDITKDIYSNNDFIIRKLDLSRFKKEKLIGPRVNPFDPWEKVLEIAKVGKYHQLILNKYPVQFGHILLITNRWKPQNGWLDINDWRAVKEVNNDTSGLWFFNSGPLAGASQPHRHIQLLRRDLFEKNCPREDWFLNFENYENKKEDLYKNIIVKRFNFKLNISDIYKQYLELSRKIGLGNPLYDLKPKAPYNLIITNSWIAIIKRARDNLFGYSINGLGFAGYILVTSKSNLEYLKTNGPENLLKNFV